MNYKTLVNTVRKGSPIDKREKDSHNAHRREDEEIE